MGPKLRENIKRKGAPPSSGTWVASSIGDRSIVLHTPRADEFAADYFKFSKKNSENNMEVPEDIIACTMPPSNKYY